MINSVGFWANGKGINLYALWLFAGNLRLFMYDFSLCGALIVQQHSLCGIQNILHPELSPLDFYVWGYAPYNPSTANQLKCSSLRSIISLDSWFRLFIPYSQLTLALWNNNPEKYILYRLNEKLLIHYTSMNLKVIIWKFGEYSSIFQKGCLATLPELPCVNHHKTSIYMP